MKATREVGPPREHCVPGRRAWRERIVWLAIGAALGGAVVALVLPRPRLASDGEAPKIAPMVDVRAAGDAERRIRTRAESGAPTMGERRRSFREILHAGGPGFRVQERVADWSLQATADELLTALQGVDEWPALSTDVRPGVINQLINRLAQLDGAAAADMGVALRELEGAGFDFLQTAYSSWLAEEPEAAIEHALKRRTEPSDANFTFFTGLLVQLGESDPNLANAVAETMVWSGNEFLANLARTRRADLFAEALDGNASLEFLNEWVAAGRFAPQEIEMFRAQLMRWTINADGDPRRLAQLMDRGLEIDEDLRWDAVRVLAKGDAARANQFLLGQSDPEKRAEELTALLDAQAERGADALVTQAQTMDWLIASYQGADRQTLLVEASKKLMETDLNLAWRTASAMADDGLKFASTYAVGFDWLSKDAATARARLPRELVERYDLIHELYSSATTGFPPEVKLQLSFTR